MRQALALIAIAALSCTRAPEPAPPTPCDNGACAPGYFCDSGNRCVAGTSCGTFHPIGTRIPPRVMLAIDRSGSMGELEGGTGSVSKWADLVDALARPGGLLDQTKDRGVFGLAFFPAIGATACEPGSILVQPSFNAVPQIISQLRSIETGGGSPSAAMLNAIAADATFMNADSGATRMVLLMTDGLPDCNNSLTSACESCVSESTCTACLGASSGCGSNCSCSDPATCLDGEALVAAVKNLKSLGVNTLIVGFGAGTASGPAADILNQAALEGGLANPSPPFYTQADDGRALQRALFLAIAGSLQPCAWHLAQPPVSARGLQILLRDLSAKSERWLVQGTDWKFESPELCFSPTPVLRRDCGVELSAELCIAFQAAPPDRYQLQFVCATGT